MIRPIGPLAARLGLIVLAGSSSAARAQDSDEPKSSGTAPQAQVKNPFAKANTPKTSRKTQPREPEGTKPEDLSPRGSTAATPKAGRIADPKERPPAIGEAANYELVIIADGESNRKAGDLKESVRYAAEEAIAKRTGMKGKRFSDENVIVLPLTLEEYEFRLRLFDPRSYRERKGVGKVSLRPRVNLSEWELTLGGPYTLGKLTIEARSKTGESLPPIIIDPADVSDASRLQAHPQQLGFYVVKPKLPAEAVPIGFTVESYDGDRALPPEKVNLEQVETYWEISVLNLLPEDQRTLFENLRDKEITPNKIYGLRAAPMRQYVNACVKVVPPTGSTVITDTGVEIRISNQPDISPKRVWMKFPLTREQAEQEAKALGDWEELRLPQEIREEGTILTADVRTGIAPDQARWYEIPESPDKLGFYRKFPALNLDQWRVVPPEKRRVWRLLVWEGVRKDNAPVALFVPDPGLPRGAPLVSVLVSEDTAWPTTLDFDAPDAPPE